MTDSCLEVGIAAIVVIVAVIVAVTAVDVRM